MKLQNETLPGWAILCNSRLLHAASTQLHGSQRNNKFHLKLDKVPEMRNKSLSHLREFGKANKN